MNLSDNPAYDSTISTVSSESHDQQRPLVRGNPYVESATLERRRLEHTYESLSDFQVCTVKVDVNEVAEEDS